MIIMDKERCIDCGECVRECYGHHLSWVDGKVIPPAGSCLDCGHCLAVCPMEAITIEGYDNSQIRPYDKALMIPDPKHLLAAMQYKRSIRRYKKKPVPPDVLKQLLEAARYSPTVGNFQTMRFAVLQESKMPLVTEAAKVLYEAKLAGHDETALFRLELLESIYQASLKGQDKLFHNAPAVIVIMDKKLSAEPGANAYIAASRLELMAQALGLGTCYVGLFVRAGNIQPALFDLFQLPDDYEVYLTLTVGYPAAGYRRTVPRKPLEVQWM